MAGVSVMASSVGVVELGQLLQPRQRQPADRRGHRSRLSVSSRSRGKGGGFLASICPGGRTAAPSSFASLLIPWSGDASRRKVRAPRRQFDPLRPHFRSSSLFSYFDLSFSFILVRAQAAGLIPSGLTFGVHLPFSILMSRFCLSRFALRRKLRQRSLRRLSQP